MASVSAADAKAYFVAKGYTNIQASAIVGGLETESGSNGQLNLGAVNPGDQPDGGASTGIAQWSPSRWAAENSYASSIGADPYSANAELGFVDYEMRNSPSTTNNAYNNLQSATTPEDATAAFLGYEAPAGYTPGNPLGAVTYGQRLANTESISGLATDQEEAQALSMDNGISASGLPLENVPGDHSGTGPDNPTVVTVKPDGKSASSSKVSTGGATAGSIAQAIASAGNAISKTIGTSEQAAQTAAQNSVTTEAKSFFDSLKDYFGRGVIIVLGLVLVAGAVYLFTKDKLPTPKIISA